MSEKKIPVRVDEEQYDVLTQIRKDIGTPIAESVRRAIFEYVKRNYPTYLTAPAGEQRNGMDNGSHVLSRNETAYVEYPE